MLTAMISPSSTQFTKVSFTPTRVVRLGKHARALGVEPLDSGDVHEARKQGVGRAELSRMWKEEDPYGGLPRWLAGAE